MAKRAIAKKRVKKARKAKRASFSAAMRALRSAGVPKQQFGRFSEQGEPQIDHDRLEALKKKLKGDLSKVRFVALNAPFKRRSPISPA